MTEISDKCLSQTALNTYAYIHNNVTKIKCLVIIHLLGFSSD